MKNRSKPKVYLVIALVMLINSIVFLFLNLAVSRLTTMGISVACFSIALALSVFAFNRKKAEM